MVFYFKYVLMIDMFLFHFNYVVFLVLLFQSYFLLLWQSSFLFGSLKLLLI